MFLTHVQGTHSTHSTITLHIICYVYDTYGVEVSLHMLLFYIHFHLTTTIEVDEMYEN